MHRWGRRFTTVLAAGFVLAANSCSSSTDAAKAILCLLTEFSLDPASITVEQGDVGVSTFKFTSTTACEDDPVFTVTSDNTAIVTTTFLAPSAKVQSDGTAFGEEKAWIAQIDPRGVAPGGPIPVHIHTAFQGVPADDRVLSVRVIAPTTGTLSVDIQGLPTFVSGDVVVTLGLSPVVATFSFSGTKKLPPGTYVIGANNVTGSDGKVYAPSPPSAVVSIVAGQTTSQTIVYTLVPPSTTGTANIQIGGLPSGSTGSVLITGNGVNQTVTQSGNVTLPNGTYSVTSSTVSTTNNDYADPQPSRQVTIIGGQTLNVIFTYAIIATLVNLNITGLEAGLSPMVTLTKSGSTTQTITTNTAAQKLAVGLWTIAVIDRTVSIRTYQRTGASALTINVLAQTTAMQLLLAYYCAKFQWTTSGTLSVFSDPYGHQATLQMILVAHALSILWQFPDPAPGPTAGINMARVTQETVTISGQSPFITVTGTRAANGSLNLTGTGTAAGFQNVPALLTGILSGTGVLSGGQYKMDRDPPVSLPNGSITYNISSPAAPAILAPVIGPRKQ